MANDCKRDRNFTRGRRLKVNPLGPESAHYHKCKSENCIARWECFRPAGTCPILNEGTQNQVPEWARGLCTDCLVKESRRRKEEENGRPTNEC